MRLSMRPVAGLAAALAMVLPATAGAAPCVGDSSAAGVPRLPGPRLRLGINPSGVAGALGPAVPAIPDRPEKTLAALGRLQPVGGAPLALRLNRLFWSGGEPLVQEFAARTRRYTSRGYLVELQVRYHPTPAQEGDITGFVRFVRHVVRRFGADPRVVAVQVTNEANLTFSPDSSDGAYEGVREALVQGVIAAKDEARRRHYSQLSVGFNWVYRSDPNTDQSFWSYLGAHGGPRFRAALDWVGLDAYPGTFFPPTEPPGGERDGLVNAMSVLRKCFMPVAALGPRVPIHVEETGWPTGPGRPESRQLSVARDLLRTLDEFRGTYNVTDARWFDLRDHNSSSANFQHHYGLLRDDYSPKPAFEAFRSAVANIAARPAHPPRLRIAVRTSRARAARLLRVPLGLAGADVARVVRVDWIASHRVLARRTTRPFAVAVRRARHRRLLVRAVAVFADGRVVPLRRVLRARER